MDDTASEVQPPLHAAAKTTDGFSRTIEKSYGRKHFLDLLADSLGPDP